MAIVHILRIFIEEWFTLMKQISDWALVQRRDTHALTFERRDQIGMRVVAAHRLSEFGEEGAWHRAPVRSRRSCMIVFWRRAPTELWWIFVKLFFD